MISGGSSVDNMDVLLDLPPLLPTTDCPGRGVKLVALDPESLDDLPGVLSSPSPAIS